MARWHGRQERRSFARGGDGSSSARRVKPVLGDYRLVGKSPEGSRQPGGRLELRPASHNVACSSGCRPAHLRFLRTSRYRWCPLRSLVTDPACTEGVPGHRWAEPDHALTRTISYWSAVGGMPVSNLALTTPRRLPKRAAVLGVWNRSLVMTSSTTPDRRCRPSRIRVTWLEFCTAHSRRPSNTIPSTVGTLTPAILALAPVLGSTEYRAPLAEWATIRVLPLAVAWMPLRLNAPLVSAAGPLSASVLDGPGTPARLTGTKYN